MATQVLDADTAERTRAPHDAMGVLLDDGGAVLFLAAQTLTVEQLAMAVRYSSGLVHAAMYSDCLDRLRIPDQPVFASEDSGTHFTVAVDAVGVGTGISAADRTLTLRTLADPTTVEGDLRRPGHVMPVRCRTAGLDGGHLTVWERGLAIVSAAGLEPVGAMCRLVHDDGPAVTGADAVAFAAHHRLAVYR